MRHPNRVLASLALFIASLIHGSNLSAQLTGEWTIALTAEDIDAVRDVASSGAGEYLVVKSYGIYRTTNAGATWSHVVLRERYTSVYRHIAHPDGRSIVVSRDSNDFFAGVAFASLDASTDGGATWTETRLPVQAQITDVAMIDRLHGLACAWVRDVDDSLYRTTDGGLTWRSMPMPPRSDAPGGLQMLTPTSWMMRAYDSLSVDGVNALFRTSDAGATWRRHSVPSGTAQITFLDSLLAFGAGETLPPGANFPTHDRIIRSTDGGASWTTVLEVPLRASWTHSRIAFADRLHGIAILGAGNIYRTTDGGATWVEDVTPSEIRFNPIGLAYPAPNDAMATAFAGVLAYHGRQTLVPPRLTSPTLLPDPGPLEQAVRWTPVTGATSYELQIADTIYGYEGRGNRYFDAPYLTTTTSDTSVAVTLREHKLYFFRVRARNDSLVSAWSAQTSTRTVGDPAIVPRPLITQPANLATDVPIGSDLVWTATPGALGYDYEFAIDPGFARVRFLDFNVPETSVRLDNLEPNTEYHARVRARDTSGELSEYSVVTFWTGMPASVDEPVAIAGSASLRPNVTSDRTTLYVTLNRAGNVGVRVVGDNGRVMMTVPSSRFEAGEHALVLDLYTLAAGRYTVALDVDARRLTLAMFVLR